MNFIKIFIIFSLILLFAFIANILISTGFFRTYKKDFKREILQQIALQGTEDITVSFIDSFALISSTNRSILLPEGETSNGLYYMDLKEEFFSLKHLVSLIPKPFAPHGISMVKTDNTYKVLAINHISQGHSIEVFKLYNDFLIFEKTLTDPSMISPNDLVVIDEDRFYFTNDHGYTKGIGKFLEEYFGLSVSNVIYFDGEKYIEVADGIAYANGINFDFSRNLLYIASTRGFMVKVYSRNKDGSLEFIEDIPCGTGVDNIEIDNEGNLWIGAHPNLLRFAAYAKGSKEASPSEIIKVNYRGKNDYTIKKIYIDDGSIMSASSVAASFKSLILTGNVMDDKFLILRKEN